MSLPTVSVVTAARNRPHLLKQALFSIRDQSFTDFEAIVVDDGSSSEVRLEYESWWSDLDSRFRLHFANPPNAAGSTPGRGRNEGAKTATAPLIAFLDHDDVWVRHDHLAVAVEALREHEADYFFSHVQFIPAHPDLMWVTPPESLSHCPRLPGAVELREIPPGVFARLMRHYHIHPSHSVIRRSLLDRIGGFIEGLRTADDVNLTLKAGDRAGRIVYRPEASVAIRLPEGKSFSLASSAREQTLAEYHAALDVRTSAARADVRSAARSREAWALRDLAKQLEGQQRGEACRLAWESFVLYPTAGAAKFLAASIGRALTRS